MAVTNGWGQAAVNNTIDYGKGKTTATNDWGKIYDSSASGDTSLGKAAAPSFSNLKSTSFDGIDDYCETASTYSALDGVTKATWSVWVNPTNVSGIRVVYHNPRNSTIQKSQFMLWLLSTARIDFSIKESAYIRGDVSSINFGSWNHIMCCIDTTLSNALMGKIFVNGADVTTSQNVSSLPSGIIPNAADSLYIGKEAQGYGSPFSGNIDELAIWSGVDLRNDVSTIYNSGVPNDINNNGLTAPTTWYRMGDGDTFNTLQDTNGSADLTMTNMTSGNIVSNVPT